jgi:hypothetical protein
VSNSSLREVLTPPYQLLRFGDGTTGLKPGLKAVTFDAPTENEDGSDCVHGQLEAWCHTISKFTFLPVGVLGGEAGAMGAFFFPGISKLLRSMLRSCGAMEVAAISCS